MITIPQVFVLTGTPGTGKTTVSRLLSNKLHAKHIELSKYSKENGYILEEDEERDTSIVDMDALGGALRKEIAGKDIVILDGHYGQDLLDKDEVDMVFILRKQPWNLQLVLEERGYAGEKVWENLEAEIIGVITHQSAETYPEEKLVEIDTSEKTPEATAEDIISIIRDGKKDKLKPIDWIESPKTLALLLRRPCTLS